MRAGVGGDSSWIEPTPMNDSGLLVAAHLKSSASTGDGRCRCLPNGFGRQSINHSMPIPDVPLAGRAGDAQPRSRWFGTRSLQAINSRFRRAPGSGTISARCGAAAWPVRRGRSPRERSIGPRAGPRRPGKNRQLWQEPHENPHPEPGCGDAIIALLTLIISPRILTRGACRLVSIHYQEGSDEIPFVSRTDDAGEAGPSPGWRGLVTEGARRSGVARARVMVGASPCPSRWERSR